MAKRTPLVQTPDGREMRLAQAHCARFDLLRHIPLFRELLAVELAAKPDGDLWVLDPMAGVGTLHAIAMARVVTVTNEIELPDVMIARQLWPGAICCHGDAAMLAFEDGTFDVVIVSPDFGNRYSDHHDAKDGSWRRSYTHDLRRFTGDPTYQLDPGNSGRYRATHPMYREHMTAYWLEAFRVLRGRGLMVVDVKNAILDKRVVPVVALHREILESIGFTVEHERLLPAKGHRYGANHEAREDDHTILICRKPAAEASKAA